MKERHLIEAPIEQGEYQQLDFKFEVSDNKKITRMLSAFANTDGGRLSIGVKDSGAISGVRSKEEYYMIEIASKMYTHPEVPFTARRWDTNGKTVLEIYIAPSDEKLHMAPDRDDKHRAYTQAVDGNILASEVLMQAWKKQKTKEDTLLKIGKPVEILFSWLDEHPYVSIKQFCRTARTNYYTARSILSNLVATGAMEYVVIDKCIAYKRVI